MPRKTPLASVLLASVACATAATHDTQAAPTESLEASGCTKGAAPHVAVHTARHELLLCDRGGRRTARFAVRLGRNGVGKTREGDGKVPLGRYALGRAVASARFGLFLPVGYPTPDQRARGMTGSAVGVHGPARQLRWLGRFVNAFDTTEGCVGLARDDEVRAVDAFVASRQVSEIVID